MGRDAGEQHDGRVRVGFLVHRRGGKVRKVVRIGRDSFIREREESYAF